MFQGIDFNAPGGTQLRKMLEARLEELRIKNDSPELTDRESQVIRGGLLEIKRLLAPTPPFVKSLDYGSNSTGGV
jgi:hypothetical protein